MLDVIEKWACVVIQGTNCSVTFLECLWLPTRVVLGWTVKTFFTSCCLEVSAPGLKSRSSSIVAYEYSHHGNKRNHLRGTFCTCSWAQPIPWVAAYLCWQLQPPNSASFLLRSFSFCSDMPNNLGHLVSFSTWDSWVPVWCKRLIATLFMGIFVLWQVI